MSEKWEPIKLDLPAGAKAVINYLGTPWGVVDMSEDVVLVDCGGGRFIDVGWYPVFNPAGRFVIRAFLEEWDNQLIDPVYETDPRKVAEHVARLARAHLGAPGDGGRGEP